MGEKFLDRAYKLETPEDTQALYRDWAASYEAETAENGYVTPRRCAEALATTLSERDTPVLDFGCGTGLSGLALKSAGFEVIDGMDPNPEMLEIAAEKDLYRTLTRFEIEDPAPVAQGRYQAIAAIGVIGTGAAPASTLDLLMNALDPDGLLVFSYNDHALADRSYTGRLNQWLDCGAARLKFREYGPHLANKDINADVYILEKA